MISTTVTWLGGKDFDVLDFRADPGEIAFILRSVDGSFQAHVKQDTDLEREIAEIIGAS